MFEFKDLDPATRLEMVAAINEAQTTGNIYESARFNQAGRDQWLTLLLEAATSHNEHWLAFQLEARALMKDFEGARTPSGGYTTKHVPHTASETMADGQFNRFYILGLCRRARAAGHTHLVVYRAKAVADPRPESQALIGTSMSIDVIETQLKDTKSSFKSPLVKPNSGLSVRIS